MARILRILGKIMSHITKVETKLDNIEVIKKALDYLGLKYKENSEIRMWRSIKLADLVIVLDKYDIGLQKNKENIYNLEADSYAWNQPLLRKALKDYKLKYDSSGQIFGGILKQACNMVKAAIVAQENNQTIEFSKPDENNLIIAKVSSPL